MNNDDAYAGGLLNRALDPATQPPQIRSFLKAETELLRALIPRASRVIDFGCGMGRHLLALSDHISYGLGIDYEAAYIAEAVKQADPHLHFSVANATAVPLTETFDFAVCLTNTWGTMSDKQAVAEEMRRLSPAGGSRLITAYASTSVAARSEWYANMGNEVREVTDEQVIASGGFSSEHFTESRLRGILGPCKLHKLGDIANMAQF